MEAAKSARDSFLFYMQHRRAPEHERDTGGYLQGYLLGWFENSDGIKAVGGSFTVFLQTVVLILQDLQENPAVLDYQGRPSHLRIPRGVAGIFHPEGMGADCFYEDTFNRMVFQYMANDDGEMS